MALKAAGFLLVALLGCASAAHSTHGRPRALLQDEEDSILGSSTLFSSLDASPAPTDELTDASPAPAALDTSPASDTSLSASPTPAAAEEEDAGVTDPSLPGAGIPGCPPYLDLGKYRTTDFTDTLNTTESISPLRPSADVPAGEWIQGRATFYGTDERIEAQRTACGEQAGQFGILAQGACGYTNSDGSLPFPRVVYAAAADTNEDYPGSCGRCYQVRCKSGAVFNNGRPLRMSDLLYARPYPVTDNSGREWPGNPTLTQDIFSVECWDDSRAITVRVADSCPCKYPIRGDGGTGPVVEIRTQNWCCGGNNHFDLSVDAFEELAHPSYGVMPLEYRPVDCDTNQPLTPVPGFVSKVIYGDSPGTWSWLPYKSRNNVLLAEGQGVDGSTATCSTISQGGGVEFQCKQCAQPGYQPFAKAEVLRFDIRSNTNSNDEFASSTPRGELPPLKMFLMNAERETYCGQEVVLSASNATAAGNSTLVPAADYATRLPGVDGWFRASLPLSVFACNRGSVGGLAGVDRLDFQNTNIRDADICLDNIQLV